jgi:hypothetical protein
VAWLPRYAPSASRVGGLLNLRNRSPALARAGEWITGMSRHRSLPAWDPKPFRDAAFPARDPVGEVALLADTFGRWFEPGTLRASVEVHDYATADSQVRELEALGSSSEIAEVVILTGRIRF